MVLTAHSALQNSFVKEFCSRHLNIGYRSIFYKWCIIFTAECGEGSVLGERVGPVRRMLVAESSASRYLDQVEANMDMDMEHDQDQDSSWCQTTSGVCHFREIFCARILSQVLQTWNCQHWGPTLEVNPLSKGSVSSCQLFLQEPELDLASQLI